MRRITRNVLIGILVVLVLLLALGALPGLLKSGDPYYLTATPVDANQSSLPVSSNAVVSAANLSERRYEYTTAALDAATSGTGSETGSGTETGSKTGNATEPGVSHPYWKGPVGIKGAFTHSPFDELSALRSRYPEAADGSAVFVRNNGTLYRLTITQDP